MRALSRLAGVVVGVALVSCGDPGFTAQVTIVNPHEYDVIVQVGDGESGFLSLGDVHRGTEETREHVIDFGETWVFVFRYPYDDDAEPVEVSLTRAALAAADWRVDVPEVWAARLRAAEEPPS